MDYLYFKHIPIIIIMAILWLKDKMLMPAGPKRHHMLQEYGYILEPINYAINCQFAWYVSCYMSHIYVLYYMCGLGVTIH